jgi:hypothetical protein
LVVNCTWRKRLQPRGYLFNHYLRKHWPRNGYVIVDGYDKYMGTIIVVYVREFLHM